MNVIPRKDLLLIKKHKNTKLKSDIIIAEDDDKQLITGSVMSEHALYPIGTTVIFGKYSLYQLTIQGDEYNFLSEEDIIGTSDYYEE